MDYFDDNCTFDQTGVFAPFHGNEQGTIVSTESVGDEQRRVLVIDFHGMIPQFLNVYLRYLIYNNHGHVDIIECRTGRGRGSTTGYPILRPLALEVAKEYQKNARIIGNRGRVRIEL